MRSAIVRATISASSPMPNSVEDFRFRQAWLHSRIKYSYRAVGLREPLNKFDLGLCARLIARPLRVHADGLVRDGRDAGDDVAWQ